MTTCMLSLPAILKPDFDLLGLDVGQNGTLADQLLPPQRARLRTLSINPFEGLDLLGRVPDIFSASGEMLVDATTATLSVLLRHYHRHFRPQLEATAKPSEQKRNHRDVEIVSDLAVFPKQLRFSQ